ncbi:DNA mismatch repair protein MutS [Terrihabitans rhizophilus]|uniref:DNA mismatch repair protein MutS n=1 Tax=Terrihabitans rhizophilus TaxID=3092662 RepID=A0ABU4RIJ2_9HYPH|nr:DNA mismatch repair protein MutS [Terrihabitans sp. PJ23]MDX6804653.1 DNA mismatch repair protein MutS [Terrihabitans sp. PJ23]
MSAIADIGEPAADSRVTPMMAQYIEIKTANPDCLLFYRMGDFYELFFEDAEQASRALGITLTKRGKHAGADIPMCGVPVERADDYLQRLIARGFRVAVCEQIEDPAEAKKRGGKSVVRRDVVRLVTPGTITEDSLLDPRRANLLVALSRVMSGETGAVFGLAALDISTGAFTVSEASTASLAAELARLDPAETVVPETMLEEPALAELLRASGVPLSPAARDICDGATAARRLGDVFGTATVDGFGGLSRPELCAAALAASYVARSQRQAQPPLSVPRRSGSGDYLEIDAATRASLELVRTLSGERSGSLLHAVDRTATAGGGRLLAERLASPLTCPDAIAARLDAVQALKEDGGLRADIRSILKAAPDLSRSVQRLAFGRGGPRDLACVRDGLLSADALAQRLAGVELPAALANVSGRLAAPAPALAAMLRDSLADDLPLRTHDGGFVRAGHDPELDAQRALRDDSRRVIAGMQARYAEETGNRTLRIKHTNFLGYFVEVPAAAGEALRLAPWNATFVPRQTLQGAMRFSTVELSDLETRIAAAADRALARELAVFGELCAAIQQHGDVLAGVADALAELDVAAALAELASEQLFARPRVDRSLAFDIKGGRHPVVEQALAGAAFIPNDCCLSSSDAAAGKIWLVTGPNMGGKSTFLRQNALIAILAQAGSFVPAAEAHIGTVDRLFSRVGAADDLARGRSTFMVEMVETAAILNQAGERSLVILDEIGRGTSTFDGLSIAWAAVEHLHGTNRCRALFATHFHELTQLESRLERLMNVTMRVAEWKGEVVFLHEVAPGAADRSYGIQVAKLAGLPAPVVRRARSILGELEGAERGRPRRSVLEDLPLFATAASIPQAESEPEPTMDPLAEALDALDPDALTPRAALDALYALKALRTPG